MKLFSPYNKNSMKLFNSYIEGWTNWYKRFAFLPTEVEVRSEGAVKTYRCVWLETYEERVNWQLGRYYVDGWYKQDVERRAVD